MAIIESTATALVRFTGLGIIIFNQKKSRGEIAIIRDEKHQLSIKIQQPRFKDGVDKDIIVYEDIASYNNLQKNDVAIEILTKGSSQIKGYQIYQAEGEFNRLESADTNDFRWLVNMDNLNGTETTAAKSENRHPISKLYIENGLFYVHKLDTDLFFEKIEKDEMGDELKREVFGNVAETIGVKLEADEVVFKIKIGDRLETHKLTKNLFPFRIEIKNMDYSEDAVYSDMADYYKYMSTPNGKMVELNPIKDETTTGGAISREDFCHPIEGGGFDAIDEME
ncbi:MAG TPA: hypothetical protein PKY82_01775 [Pyrinomonadaceae bacterium]|nr:hypothetical protein [Pyrinomonadaceae bacterium]